MSNQLIRFMMVLILGLILTIIPLPHILLSFRPPWILLLALYVQFYFPAYFKLYGLFFFGLLLDSLLSTVMGVHGFALCLVAWLANSKVRRFSLFPMSHQMMFIGLYAMVYQLILVMIDFALGSQGQVWMIFGGCLSSVLLWPWLRLLGDELLLGHFSRQKRSF